MRKLKRVPHEGNEYYYAIATDNFKNICIGVLGVLLYNFTTGGAKFSHPGIYGVFTIVISSGLLYLLLKSGKNWGYGNVSTFKYKKLIAKFISFILTISVGVFCSYAYDIMILPDSVMDKPALDAFSYFLKAVSWMLVYMLLLSLFAHFSINTVCEVKSK
ncbi:TPA: hypothetical protein ACSTL0_004420 [Serratia fonticola]